MDTRSTLVNSSEADPLDQVVKNEQPEAEKKLRGRPKKLIVKPAEVKVKEESEMKSSKKVKFNSS